MANHLQARWRRAIFNISVALLGIAILVWLVRDEDLLSIGELAVEASFVWIVLPKVFMLVAHWVRAVRWKMMLSPLGHEPKATNLFHGLLISYAATLLFSRIGDIFRCLFARRTDKIPIDVSFGSLIAERAVDTFSIIVLVSMAVLTNSSLFGSFLMNMTLRPLASRIGSLIPLVVLMAGLAVVAGIVAFIGLRRVRVKGRTRMGKVRSVLTNLVQGFVAIKNLRRPWLFLGYTFVIWMMYYMNFQLGYLLLDETESIGLINGFFVHMMGSLGMSAPTQSGLGAFHWTASESLKLVGVQSTAALTWAILFHGSSVVFKATAGFVSYIIISFSSVGNVNPRGDTIV